VKRFVADESRFGRITKTGRCWAPARIRPNAKAQFVRKYLYLFMTACVETGQSTSLILPRVDTVSMQIFLDQVSKDFGDDFIVMQVDQARWHIAGDLVIPENIRLIYQPAYSPETNPMEEVFDYIKENDFQNRHFDSLDAVERQLCCSVNSLHRNPQRLRSMVRYPHLIGSLNAN
jgi:hypothetical protein